MPKKRSQKIPELEAQIAKALDAIRKKEVATINAASKAYDVPYMTLSRRVKGHSNHAQGHESSQLLSHDEENALQIWCTHLTAGGYPAGHRIIRELTSEILTHRVATVNTNGMQLVTPPPIGKEWVKRFIGRYPHLKTARRSRLEFSRWKDTTVETVNEWFDAFEAADRKFNFQPQDIYNMNETGFAIGTSQSSHVVIDTTLRTRYKVEPGRQEWVLIAECICADGSFLPPLVIMKAENVSSSWISSDTPIDWQWAASPKGWTSNEHGLEWLKRVFEPATRVKAQGRQRLLICDGHDSHITGKFLTHCIDYNITLLVIPPHSSHLLQPADVAVFGPLATFHRQETDHFTNNGISHISKAE